MAWRQGALYASPAGDRRPTRAQRIVQCRALYDAAIDGKCEWCRRRRAAVLVRRYVDDLGGLPACRYAVSGVDEGAVAAALRGAIRCCRRCQLQLVWRGADYRVLGRGRKVTG